MASMSVAYRSWEAPTAPTTTVTFKAPSQGRLTQQDRVIRDFSALSLYMESQPQPEPCVIDNTDADTLSRESLANSSSSAGSPQMGYMTSPDSSNVATLLSQNDYGEHRLDKSNERLPFTLPNLKCVMDNNSLMRFENESPGHYQHLPALYVVSEDTPWESSPADSEVVESECISSCSSISGNSPCTSVDGSEVMSEESEAQSAYKGPLDTMNSLETTLPVRRSLSRFFFGQSRSFSCLADVVSVKDLAKPENPYARKRKSFPTVSNSLERPRLFALRNGAGIKKPPHNNKSTLALAVAMSTRDAMLDRNDFECRIPLVAATNWQDCAPSRSFSFSDFERTGCRLTPGCS